MAGAVEAAGGRARVFDAGLYRRPLTALRAELRAWRPDVVGLSLRNADNAAWPYTQHLHGLVRAGRGRRRARPRRRRGSSSAARRSRSSRGRCAAPLLVADGVVGDGEAAAASARRGPAPAGRRRGAARRPRRASACPRDLGRRLPRRRPLPHRRRPDRPRLSARLHLLHLSAPRGHATCGGARPRRSSTRWSGCASSSARSSSSSSTRRSTPTRTTWRPSARSCAGGAAGPARRWRTSASPATCSRA